MSDPKQDENPPHVTADLPTSGHLLQSARKASGLSIDQLSARVKVSVPRLLALEEDRLDVWPDAIVMRAVAASVCRQVQLDPTIVLDRMPKARPTALILPSSEPGANFRDRTALNLRGSSAGAAWPGKLIVIVVGLSFLVVLAWVFGAQLRSEFARVLDGDLTEESAPMAVPTASVVLPPEAGPTDTRSSALAASEVKPALAVSDGSPTSGDVASGTNERSSVASPPAPTPAIPPRVLVSFKASGETWIEVNDAKGVLLLRRTMFAGDVAGASGEVPLSVVVGRVDHTEVAVRGQALKLEPSSVDNVARFKVQ
jgi:cytoskeleton protein RodZ